MRCLLICLLLAARTHPGYAQSSGLLLGLSGGDRAPQVSDTPSVQYRTLWLAPGQGKLALVAELPTLVVPRSDGFWRLDVETSCGITEATMEMGGPFVDRYADPVWRKLGSPRTFVPGDHLLACVEARRKVREIRDTADVELYAEPCNVRDVTVTYVSPGFVSYHTYSAQTEFCSPGRYTSRVHLSVVDTLHKSLSLLESLAPARKVALTRQWDAARTDCTFEESPDENWGIIRGTGEWVTDFSSSGPTVCRGDGMAEFEIRERIPPSIARSESTEWLLRLREVVPGLDDFFVSPAGDLVVVRTGDQLHAFTVEGVRLAGPIFGYTLSPHERVILAEWAVGTHVRRWSAELSRAPRH